MTQPMSDERLEEIQAVHSAVVAARFVSHTELDDARARWSVHSGTYMRELLDEVQRLTDELDAAQSSSDRAWGREHELLAENHGLKRRLRAIALIGETLAGGHEDADLMVDTIRAITHGETPEKAIATNLGADWCGAWTRPVVNMIDEKEEVAW
jgi:hypothetical protein